MMETKFGYMVKKYMDLKGWTMKELGKKVGRGESTVSMWISGKSTPSMGVIQQLADIFGVSTDAMIKGDDVNTPSNVIPVAYKKVKMLGSIAAGSPIYANQEYDMVTVPDNQIHCDFALKIEGDSMVNDNILDGDIVFIKTQDIVKNGEIAAVVVDDSATLKHFYYYPENSLVILKPANPMYQDLIYTGEQINTIKILGKAVGLSRKI